MASTYNAHVYDALAYCVIGLHFAFLGYVVIGGFVAWRWPATIAAHLAAVIWGVLIVVAHLLCPLTWAMNELHDLAGDRHHTHSFINAYVRGVLYPAHAELATQAIVALLVITSWVGLAVRLRHRRARASRPCTPASSSSERTEVRS